MKTSSTTKVKLVQEPHPLQMGEKIWRAYYANSMLPIYLGAEDKQDLKDRVLLYFCPRQVEFVE